LAGGWRSNHFGFEHVAAAGHELDDLALVVAKGGAKFADALKQAVFADVNIRPDGLHQLLLAEDSPRVADKQNQEVKCLGPELDDPAIGPSQLGTLLIEFKTSKTEH
jgi:hypothetical protein